MNFKNKVVIVTGASSGIGAATALQFAKEGANVVLVGRDEERLQDMFQKCSKLGGNHLKAKADVTIKEDLKILVDKVIKKYEKINVLVNSAGIAKYTTVADENIFEVFNTLYATNLRSTVYLTHLVAPYLAKTKGNIVNIGSIASNMPPLMPVMILYGSTKAALVHFTRGSAQELAPQGVRVNVVSPGPVQTDILTKAGVYDCLDKFNLSTPAGRPCFPEEIAEIVVFLASDKATVINGEEIVADHGFKTKAPT